MPSGVNVRKGGVIYFRPGEDSDVLGTPRKGMIKFDHSTSKLRFYTGSSWSDVGITGGTGSLDASYAVGASVDIDSAGGDLTFNCSTNTDNFVIDVTNSSTSATGLKFNTTSGTFTTAVDLSDAGIVNAFDIGANAILGTNFSVTAAGGITAADITITGDYQLNDTVELQFGTGDDLKMNWDGTDFIVEWATENTGIIKWGLTNGGDQIWYGNTNTDNITFDAGVPSLVFNGVDLTLNDNDILGFGDAAADGTIASDGTNIDWSVTTLLTIGDGGTTDYLEIDSNGVLIIRGAGDLQLVDSVAIKFGTGSDMTLEFNATDLLFEWGAQNTGILKLGATNGGDVILYGNTNTDTLTFDSGNPDLTFNGVDLSLEDNDILNFGDANDINMTWNGTDLLIEWATQSTGIIKFGATNSGDVIFYGETATDTLTFDASVPDLTFNGVDISLEDTDILQFGDANDITMTWDGTDLIVEWATENTGIIKWGTTNGGDMVWYGNTNTNTVTWDASANDFTFNGVDISLEDADILQFGDANDDTITHNGTDTLWTHTTGDLTFDNQLVTGSTIMLLGTDTTATDFQVQNNSAAALFTVTPTSATAGTVVAAGFRATSDTAAAITAARTLTSADSGGFFSVAKTGAYEITLPTPTQGLKFTFLMLDTGANAVTFTNGSAHLFGQIQEAGTVPIAMTGTTLTAAASQAVGDWLEFFGIDSTHYIVTGSSISASKFTIA